MCAKRNKGYIHSHSHETTVTSQTYGDARLELHKSTPYLAQAGRLGRGPIHIRLYLAALDRCIYTYARVHTEARSAYRLSIAFFSSHTDTSISHSAHYTGDYALSHKVLAKAERHPSGCSYLQ